MFELCFFSFFFWYINRNLSTKKKNIFLLRKCKWPCNGLFLVGHNWIFKKPCKIPEKDVWPGCSISTTRWSNSLFHVSMHILLITLLYACLTLLLQVFYCNLRSCTFIGFTLPSIVTRWSKSFLLTVVLLDSRCPLWVSKFLFLSAYDVG